MDEDSGTVEEVQDQLLVRQRGGDSDHGRPAACRLEQLGRGKAGQRRAEHGEVAAEAAEDRGPGGPPRRIQPSFQEGRPALFESPPSEKERASPEAAAGPARGASPSSGYSEKTSSEISGRPREAQSAARAFCSATERKEPVGFPGWTTASSRVRGERASSTASGSWAKRGPGPSGKRLRTSESRAA